MGLRTGYSGDATCAGLCDAVPMDDMECAAKDPFCLQGRRRVPIAGCFGVRRIAVRIYVKANFDCISTPGNTDDLSDDLGEKF